MIKVDAINLKQPERMIVTWDVGRRCNYDCSYCEASRHNNYSKHHSYEELLLTFEFIKEYTSIYNRGRKDVTGININFTGGEPTVNPAFWKLAEHIKNTETDIGLSLTTNGAWSPKNTSKIVDIFNGVTVSYHAEADDKLKEQVKENIKLLNKEDIWLQVNVMMHVDYFDECANFCKELKALGIKYTPRPIGDGNIERSGWFKDTDGIMRRTSHLYSKEQQEWYFDHLNSSQDIRIKREGTELGRKCCGGRCTVGKVNNEWQEVKLIDTHFKGWFCSVNQYFLHIDQHTGNVYHHQTCQALHDGLKGPLGNLNNTSLILNYVKSNKDKIIVCPNERCGCGMCVPKAKELIDFISLS